MRAQVPALARVAAETIGGASIVALAVAGSSVRFAYGQTPVAPRIAQASADRIAVAEAMANDISSAAYVFMQIVLKSKWGAGYGMLKPADPGRRDPSYQRVKAAERPMRDLISRLMNRTPGLRSADLSYGDFSLFVERRFSSPVEREEWIQSSGGDMYGGPFSWLSFGEELAPRLARMGPDAFTSVDSVWVRVPVVKKGRFVCVLEVEFDKSP